MSMLSGILFVARLLFKLALISLQSVVVVGFAYVAYDIRLYSAKDYGMIIHEFDPWFNYRAAEYLAEHGLSKFFKWYDYMSWYPIGRPIGTTIYPGMQMAAVWIYETMKVVPSFKIIIPRWLWKSVNTYVFAAGWLPKYPKKIEYVPMSVNDICCMIPPWFGSLAAIFTGLIAWEATRSVNASIMAVGIMAIIPAHLMRSVAGEFDNEAVAMTAICATFWLWLRSVRNPSSWPWAVLGGVMYVYMVAAWGGYIFVLNMIGVHALMLVGLGRFNSGVHKAYTIFFIIGTSGAMQIPVVGWQPVRSLEQLGPLLVFLGYQVLQYCDFQRRRQKMKTQKFVYFRFKCMCLFIVALVVVAFLLWPTGYFGPLSARIRGLFVKHTKTGNPLVDSVAEHQPASPAMYSSYLNLALDYAPMGGIVLLFSRNNACYFLALYSFIATHFSLKMSRLVLICAPICSILCAVWCGFLLDFLMEPVLLLLGKPGFKNESYVKEDASNGKASKSKKKTAAKSAKDKDSKELEAELAEWEDEHRPGGASQVFRFLKAQLFSNVPENASSLYEDTRRRLDTNVVFVSGRIGLSVLLLWYIVTLSGLFGAQGRVPTFVNHCHNVARQLANPKVMFKTQDRQGRDLLIDDYYQGYLWIDKNTPKDSRVMAWWDYGYQITGIAKRTSIADGNTWNHEHIATLGRTLTSPEKKAWNAIRHLADYVLVWAGGRGDDLAKSPHLARIGNSVFPEHCGDDDPKCNKFGFNGDRSPTPMMANSFLYKAVMHNMVNGVKLNNRLFKEVHTTKYGLMRVFKVLNVSQESKDWIADPKNRVCDAPGSWYCVGQYPPALDKLIQKRRTFAQVEDFNKGGSKSAYTRMIEKEQRREL